MTAELTSPSVLAAWLRAAVGLLFPLGRVDGASWLSHALHEEGQCRVHDVLLRHVLLLRVHNGLRVHLASAVAEGLVEEGLWGSPPAMHMRLLGRRDRLHRHCGCAMPHHIAMVMRRSRRAARARRVARAQSSLVAGRWAVAATAAAAAVAAAALVAAAAWQALSLRVDWRVGLALGRDQS